MASTIDSAIGSEVAVPLGTPPRNGDALGARRPAPACSCAAAAGRTGDEGNSNSRDNSTALTEYPFSTSLDETRTEVGITCRFIGGAAAGHGGSNMARTRAVVVRLSSAMGAQSSVV